MKRNYVRVLTAALTLAGACTLGLTEEEGTMGLSMEASVEIALRNNRVLSAARQERVKARGRVIEARAEALPEVSFDAAGTHLGEEPSATSGGEQDTYTLSANLAQPVYKGGRVQAGLRAATLYREYARQKERETVQQITAAARAAYLDVLLKEKLVSVQREALERAERHLEDVKARRRAGFVTDYEVLRGEVEVAGAKASLTEAQNALRISRTQFLNVLGLDLDVRFELTDEMRYSPLSPEWEATKELAAANRPDLAQARLTLDIQKESVKAARSELLPRVFLVGNWEGGTSSRYAFGGTGDWESGWSVGITATLSLFDGMRTRGRLIQERASLEQYRLLALDLEQRVTLEVKDSLLKMANADELVRVQEEAVKLAEEGERLAQSRYRTGKGTQLEVLDAQLALSAARTDLARATYGHELAVVELERVTGTIDEPSLAEGILR